MSSIAPINPPNSLKGLWTGNLLLAKKLVSLAEESEKDSDLDMYYRGATSKVYYALFHLANRYARAYYPGKKFRPPDRKQAHQRLIEWYETESGNADAHHVPELVGIHMALDIGRSLRTVVDYEEKTSPTSDGQDFGSPEKVCRDMYAAAREPIADLEQLINNSIRQQFAQKAQFSPRGNRPHKRRR